MGKHVRNLYITKGDDLSPPNAHPGFSGGLFDAPTSVPAMVASQVGFALSASCATEPVWSALMCHASCSFLGALPAGSLAVEVSCVRRLSVLQQPLM